MKKLLLISLTIMLTAIFFNSCEKEMNKKPAGSDINISMSAKKATSVAELLSGLPDLTINATRLQSSAVVKTAVFKSNDCAVIEGCVGGTGKRKLLRFDVATPNIGTADLFLGDPRTNPIFELSACHGHYHFSGYAMYELLNSDGSVRLIGRKQAFCLLDYARYDANAGPAKYTCSYQGISVGWQDVYGSYLDCQWLDVTGIAPGIYTLRVSINPEQILTESNYNNNVASVPVKISK